MTIEITAREAILIIKHLGNQWIEQGDQKEVYNLINRLRELLEKP